MTTPLMFKTTSTAWVYNPSKSVTSITRSGSTATVTQTAHGGVTGDIFVISGAIQTEYNGSHTIVRTGADTYTYTVSGAPATPATGTITATGGITQITDANYPTTTVPGISLLDGTYYVMDSNGVIYGSDLEDPLNWNALNFITAEIEPDGGVALSKYLNYVVAFGEWSTEVFEDAQNSPSPLGRVQSAYIPMGCSHARSVAQCEGSLIWMAQTKEGPIGPTAGRTIMMMSGFQAKPISTPNISRIINADDLATVYSMAFKQNGHSFYLLTLVTSNITLVYDITTGVWNQWTSRVAQSALTGTTLSYSSSTGLVTATKVGHSYSDGDVVVIAGATQTDYNGTYNINYVSSSVYTYQPTVAPSVALATGTITTTGYTSTYVKFIMHTVVEGVNQFLHETNGYLYSMADTTYSDDGVYIDYVVRTPNVDNGNSDAKKISRITVVGDKQVGNVYLRYSKDDYQTYSNYRKIDLSLQRSKMDRIGKARRASFDIRVTDNIPVRIERLDILFDEGD